MIYTTPMALVFSTYFKIIQMYVKITNNMVFCSFFFVDVFLEAENWDLKRLMYVPTIKCSAIEGISHRYHHCRPVCMWRSRVNIEEVAYKWHLGYLGAIGLLKPTRGRLTPRLETSSLLSLHVNVWRLIF
jgi:hypothetical protein